MVVAADVPMMTAVMTVVLMTIAILMSVSPES